MCWLFFGFEILVFFFFFVPLSARLKALVAVLSFFFSFSFTSDVAPFESPAVRQRLPGFSDGSRPVRTSRFHCWIRLVASMSAEDFDFLGFPLSLARDLF